VDLTKEQFDKEAVKDLPGKIVLDQKERERAQLPNVNPKAIQVKSIDKIGESMTLGFHDVGSSLCFGTLKITVTLSCFFSHNSLGLPYHHSGGCTNLRYRNSI